MVLHMASVLKCHGKMWYNFAVPHFAVPNFAPAKISPPRYLLSVTNGRPTFME